MQTRDVIIRSGALEQEGETIVLRGVIDPSSLDLLQIDEYQRHDMERDDIYRGLRDGTAFPDIQIGLRSQEFRSDGDTFYLPACAYVIDGWQRVSSAKRLMDLVVDANVRLGAKVHFGTDLFWETKHFEKWNAGQRKISPSKLLANRKERNVSVNMLMGLTENEMSFPLVGRVCWSQSMARRDLITAMSVTKISLMLHRHRSSARGWRYEQVADGLDVLMSKLPVGALRHNINTFFQVIDQCWGLRDIEYRLSAPQTKEVLLWALAGLFSDHLDFWDDDQWLSVDPNIVAKLSKFSLRDVTVQRLAGSGGRSREVLYFLLRNHVNKGVRTNILRPRANAKWAAMEDPNA